jgi:hypothetical protein
VERAPDTAALQEHRLQLFAARSWRASGRQLPVELRADEHRAAVMALAVPLLVARARAAYGGTLMLMKGPEAAASRPVPETRYFRDLDFLVDDPIAAQRALVAHGFFEGGEFGADEDAQHLQPLAWPGLPLVVEVHRRPNCPPWLTPPPSQELFRGAVPSVTGVEGVLAPAPAVHALLLAAHSWAHRPLTRLADFIDIVAVLGGADRNAVDELARQWGWEGMWRTTIAAAEAILADRPCPLSLRIWARHLQPARECTLLESHLRRIAAPIWAMPLRHAPRAVGVAFKQVAGKHQDESWGDKRRRSSQALAHAFMTESAHGRAWERSAE